MHRLSEMSDAQCILDRRIAAAVRPEQESGIGQLRQRGFEVRSASDVIDEFKAELTPEYRTDLRDLFGSGPEPVEARDQRGVQGRGNRARTSGSPPKSRLADPPDRRTGASAASPHCYAVGGGSCTAVPTDGDPTLRWSVGFKGLPPKIPLPLGKRPLVGGQPP